jgi:hypothetical protein
MPKVDIETRLQNIRREMLAEIQNDDQENAHINADQLLVKTLYVVGNQCRISHACHSG